MEMNDVHNCVVKLRENPKRHKERVIIGCGAGFAGDRPMGALKLLQRIKKLDYLILECLAERTLADRYKIMISGGKGYDPRIKEWMRLLLPLAIERGVCIITNMGAVDPLGAQKEVLEIATELGFRITVSVAHEISEQTLNNNGCSTYLGAAPIVHCLEKYNKPNIVITSRIADASLFLAPMVYELGWNWNEYELLAKGAIAGHLLECGCQLTGGYFMHPGDAHRKFSFEKLLEVSLPFAEINHEGEVYLEKIENSGGELSFNTCAQQLLYEIGDPSCYVTPDVIIDLREVSFQQVSEDRVLCRGAKSSIVSCPPTLLQLVPTDCGWKGWGEISYGGHECIKRAQAAEFLVRSWMNETFPEISNEVIAYIIGHDSLKITNGEDGESGSNGENSDIRLRMDGLFVLEEHAICFIQEFMALYTNGPAGGGGISMGHKKEMILHKKLVERENISWQTNSKQTNPSQLHQHTSTILKITNQPLETNFPKRTTAPIQQIASGTKIPLYKIAHSRAGDKGNDINFSLIPHLPSDINRLKKIITPNWVKIAVSPLFKSSTLSEEKDLMVESRVDLEIYEVAGINSLNVVVRNVLDGGVNCSRRIDRHGKTLSDFILSQMIVLPW